jgi:hypothetical protein
METVRIPPSPPFFPNGSRNKGLAAEQKVFYKSFLRNLRTSRKSQYLAKARKSDPQPKFQLYKHIKISGKWRYCRAAIYSNGKVKPHVVVVGGRIAAVKIYTSFLSDL